MKKTVLIVVSTVLVAAIYPFTPLFSAPVKLSGCSIYMAPDQPDSVFEAAQELKFHIKLATGCDLKIVSVPTEKNMIVVGAGKEAEKANINASKLPYEGHRILTRNGNLYIVGRDISDDGMTPMGGYSFGTLYGVYHFLNKVMGIEWPYPSDKGIYAPKLGKDYTVPELDITYTPKFQVRRVDLICVWQRVDDLRMWLQRNYHKLPDVSKPNNLVFGTADYPFSHSWDALQLYPQKKNTLFESGEETFRKHPEYFWMSEGGVRMKPGHNFSLCLSNPGALEDISARYVKVAKAKNKQVISVSPNDGTVCCCPACQALSNDLAYVKAHSSPYELTKGRTPLYLNYYRTVCKKMEQECPGVVCTGFIYESYLYAPRPRPAKMPSNFMPWMAPLIIAYGPTRLYEPINQAWHDWLNDWRGVFDNNLYFGYDFYYRSGGTNIPWPIMPGLLRDTMKTLLRDNSCKGLFNSGIGSLGATAVNNWLLMKMDYCPEDNPEVLVKEYFTKAFGTTAGKDIHEMFHIFEKNLKDYLYTINGKMSYYVTPEALQAIHAKDWETIRKLADHAQTAPKDEGEHWRFEMFRRNLRITDMLLVKMGFAKENKSSSLYLSEKEFHALLDRYKFEQDLEFYVSPMYYNSVVNRLRPVKVRPIKIESGAPYHPYMMYWTSDFVVYAPEDMEICMKFDLKCIVVNPATGKPYLPGIPFFQVRDSSSKNVIYEGFGNSKDGTIRFPAKKGQHYHVIFAPETALAYGPVYRLLKSNVPYALSAYVQPRGFPVRSITEPVTFYLNVPESSEKFTVIARFRYGHYRIVDPNGKVLLDYETKSDYNTHEIDRKKLNAPAGLYRIEVLKSHIGFLCLEGVPPFLFTDPEKGLIVEALPGK